MAQVAQLEAVEQLGQLGLAAWLGPAGWLGLAEALEPVAWLA